MARAYTHLNVLITWLILASFFIEQVDADVVGWSYDPKRGVSLVQCSPGEHAGKEYWVDGGELTPSLRSWLIASASLRELVGPDVWKNSYPDCAGLLQSPINIVTKDAVYHHKLQYININNYSMTDGVKMNLVNKDGHTAEVVLSGKPIYIQEGSLPDVYKLEQFHFHWGAEDNRGSEHSIDGEFYPMELHLVHYQHHLDNFTAASNHPFGLAVFAFLFKVVPQDNIKLNSILKHFPKIVNPNIEVEIETFMVRDILPDLENLDFYRYDGSLTSPPCFESVIWSVAVENIEISENQLSQFRNLSDDNHAHLVDDFRPIQPEHSRLITTTLRVSNNNVGSKVTACLLVLSPSLLSVLYYSLLY